MPDTGPPWEIPYVEDTDLVRDYPQASEDLADAIAAGLDAAGGLVAVKHVLKTDTFTASSVAAGGNVAVTDLEITHEVADPTNRLIITAYFGAAANSQGRGNCAIAVNEFTSGGDPENVLIGVGDAEGSRTRVGAGGQISPADSTVVIAMPSVTFVHTPGEGEKTYSVLAVNIRNAPETLFVNRSQDDSDATFSPRAASALVIQEVKV